MEPTFADLGLAPVLVHALRRTGVRTPFEIQSACIPDALAGKDVLGRAPTGSGKTLAFGLPMLTRLAGAPSAPSSPRGLVLAPTRELAMQIEQVLDEPAAALGLRVAAVVGGVPMKRQVDRLRRGVDLLVATPGRLQDLRTQGAARLDTVTTVTVDEADRMADMGFLPQVRQLLDAVPKDGQRQLFSATLDGEVDALVRRYLRSPVTHSVGTPESAPDLTHYLLFVGRTDKWRVVAEIAARDGRTVLFARTRHGVDRLEKQLQEAGIACGALHSGRTQGSRTRALAQFADGSVPVLIATDVAARGIHVDDVSLVVHVDPPADAKDYVHRAGRTARAGEHGTVVTVVTEDERGAVTELAEKAGIDGTTLEVRPGDRRLAEITGARTPPGPRPAAGTARDTTPKRDTRYRGARRRRPH